MSVDHKPEAVTPILGPREAWALGRPVLWLVPLVYAILAVVVPLTSWLSDPELADRAVSRWLFLNAAYNVGLLVGVAFTGVVLVAVGWRRLWVAPALLFFFLPGLPDLLNIILIGDWAAAPEALVQWVGDGWGPLSAAGWMGGPLELTFLLAPGMWLAHRKGPRPERPRLRHEERASLAVVVLVIGMVVYVRMALSPSEPRLGDELIDFAPLVVFGAALGTARGWWPWAHLAAGVLVVGPYSWTHGAALSRYYLPLALAALLASLWQPLARLIQTADRGPFATLILLNILNVADAVLTQLSVVAGQAVELNPFVTTFGMPIKLVLVAAASLLIYRLLPKALIWPTLALGAVAVWHLMGLIVNS